jgi:hypothetical protein
MKRCLFFCAFVALCLAATVHEARADTLFESGTLGPTGVTWDDLTNGAVPSTSIDTFVYSGVRFHLNTPVITSQIGGHFVAADNGTFFGVIVALGDEDDFPDSLDFSTPDLLGSTLLTFPVSSDEVFGNLTLSLEPGWYALVFGSGLFGAIGDGATVRNGTDISNPRYIGLQPFSGFGWFNRSTTLNRRFVVLGEIVPEPTTVLLGSMALMLLILPQRILINPP